jgi:hypothetical protein
MFPRRLSDYQVREAREEQVRELRQKHKDAEKVAVDGHQVLPTLEGGAD